MEYKIIYQMPLVSLLQCQTTFSLDRRLSDVCLPLLHTVVSLQSFSCFTELESSIWLVTLHRLKNNQLSLSWSWNKVVAATHFRHFWQNFNYCAPVPCAHINTLIVAKYLGEYFTKLIHFQSHIHVRKQLINLRLKCLHFLRWSKDWDTHFRTWF